VTASQDPAPGDDRDAGDSWTPPQPQPRPPYRMGVTDQVLSIVGFVCAAVAVLFSPVLFGLAGIVLGIVGHTKGEPLGRWAAVAAGAGMILGTVLTVIVESLMS
jgi:hypothetical protein